MFAGRRTKDVSTYQFLNSCSAFCPRKRWRAPSDVNTQIGYFLSCLLFGLARFPSPPSSPAGNNECGSKEVWWSLDPISHHSVTQNNKLDTPTTMPITPSK
mmetsp:Transcript_39341/g.70847  ORF Transcript_39341/g.70847 Transcript_39341/m.70847 type:complete len:101 (-) Transcript_39341:2775-3077(-)